MSDAIQKPDHPHVGKFDYFCVPCFKPVMESEIVGWEQEKKRRGGNRPLCPNCTDCVDME